MKKFLTIFMLSLTLCGCSQGWQAASKLSPCEISVNDTTLSYYDEPSAFEENDFEIQESSLKSVQSKTNNIYINKDNTIRNIVVSDKGIITYKNISVGDNINKLKKSFTHITNIGDNYSVLFDGEKEVDPKNASVENDFIWLNFTTDDGTITKIAIYDVKFGKEMR